jgi:hypothetical protein
MTPTEEIYSIMSNAIYCLERSDPQGAYHYYAKADDKLQRLQLAQGWDELPPEYKALRDLIVGGMKCLGVTGKIESV